MAECVSQMAGEHLELAGSKIVVDEKEKIQAAILEALAAPDSNIRLILTSGGTGFAPRDVTPEAVSELFVRHADSLNQMMQSEALKVTPMACLSRSVIGMVPCTGGQGGQALVVTLPGKPKAVKENFEILIRNRVLLHCLHQLRGEESH